MTGSALVGYSKSEREAAGKKGGVVRAGYMAAFMADEGTSLTDIVGGADPWWYERKVNYPSFPALLSSPILTQIQAPAPLLLGPRANLLPRHSRGRTEVLYQQAAVAQHGNHRRQSHGRELEGHPDELFALRRGQGDSEFRAGECD